MQNRFLLTAMTQRQLRLAITAPAAAAGARVDGELVRVLLDEVRTRITAAPPAAEHAEAIGAGVGFSADGKTLVTYGNAA